MDLSFLDVAAQKTSYKDGSYYFVHETNMLVFGFSPRLLEITSRGCYRVLLYAILFVLAATALAVSVRS